MITSSLRRFAAEIAAALAALALFMPAFAGSGATGSEAYDWRNVDIGGGGGFVDGIVFSPVQPNLIFARTDIGGAYRWDSASRRWVALTDWVGQSNGNLRGAESIAVDPTSGRRVYIAAGTYRGSGDGAILRSYDAGKTWQVSPIPVTMGANEDGRCIGERLDVDPASPNVLYFGSRHDGLWKSTDFAGTWSRVTTFPAVPDAPPRPNGFARYRSTTPTQSQAGVGFIVFDPAGARRGFPSKTLYVGVASSTIPEIYRSTDSGRTWRAVPGQPVGMLPQHGALSADGSLYITYGNRPGPNGITAGAVWKFDTHTGSWQDITPGGPGVESGGGYCGLALDAQHPETLMVSTIDHWSPHDEIYRSTDGGADWTALSPLSTRDAAGAPWLKWGNAEPAFGWWIAALAIDPFHSGRALYGTGATIWGTDEVNEADRGGHILWKDWALGIEETAVTALVSPPTGAHLISGLGDIGGFTHHSLTVSPPAGMASNPIFTTTQSIDYAQYEPSVIVRVGSVKQSPPTGAVSTDGGDTWSPFAGAPMGVRGPGSVAITGDGESIVWAPDGAPVSYSRDGGATWTPSSGLPETDPSLRMSDFGRGRLHVLSDHGDSETIYAVNTAATTLYVSTDGGASFTVVNSQLPTGASDVKAVPDRRGDLWIADGTLGLYHSVDGGATFVGILNAPEADAVGFGKAAAGHSYPAVYMVGSENDKHGVYRSDDDARSWIRINDDAHQYGWIGEPITGDPRIVGRVYLGTNGRGIVYGDPTKRR